MSGGYKISGCADFAHQGIGVQNLRNTKESFAEQKMGSCLATQLSDSRDSLVGVKLINGRGYYNN